MMKRAFTLIELMIVIAVLVTLMAITFRITNMVSDTEARTMTITRMQRLENCLSGFHAAFGCYPPVKLHGNRSFGDQEDSIPWGNEGAAWRWVEKVCRSQPVGCRFPFPEKISENGHVIDFNKRIRELSDLMAAAAASGEFNGEQDAFHEQYMQDWAAAGFAATGEVQDSLSLKKDEVLWSEIKLFQYGMMSYLLPRYFIMMGGNEKFFTSGYAQWTQNNQSPSDPLKGIDLSWKQVYEWVDEYRTSEGKRTENVTKLLMLPSQSASARWMPNLEGICRCYHYMNLFGVNIKSRHWRDAGPLDSSDINALAWGLKGACFSPEGDRSNRDQYLLDEVTVLDGWGHEFYYYSRSPYQSYTLWSSGPDGRTFPAWIAHDRLSGQELELAAKWTKDDIKHMSN